MSYQQINLYQPIFRKQQKVFSATTLVQGIGIIAAGLAALTGYAFWQSHLLNAQLAQLQTRHTEATRRMDEAQKRFPERARNPALEAEVAALRKELEGRERIAARLNGADAGNLQGFAGYLEALARQRPASLWLTDVDLRRGGQELVLRGSTLQPEQVPRYLERLASEPGFSGREFGALNIAQPEKEKGHYDFVVSTRGLDEKEEKKP